MAALSRVQQDVAALAEGAVKLNHQIGKVSGADLGRESDFDQSSPSR